VKSLSAHRRRNIGGADQCKAISGLLDCKFEPAGKPTYVPRVRFAFA
jgi:hypothetical protein